MTFNVEVVLKGRDFAVTEPVSVPHGEPGTWTDAAVRDVLVETLRAIGRAENPNVDPGRRVGPGRHRPQSPGRPSHPPARRQAHPQSIPRV